MVQKLENTGKLPTMYNTGEQPTVRLREYYNEKLTS